ncbi:MAG: hypothetical protein FWE29_01845 [Defluviitaleaceae bacterium]|nr:hypothetical protein [Defluviitaleaceae bacterium]
MKGANSGKKHLSIVRNGHIEKNESILFDSPVNVLLITDRLHDITERLKNYLQNDHDIKVDLVNNYDEAANVISKKTFDFLIIVGYLADEHSFDTVGLFRRVNKHSAVIFYAILDNYIDYLCEKYNIYYTCDRRYPFDRLLAYMKESYQAESFKMQKAQEDMSKDRCDNSHMCFKDETIEDIHVKPDHSSVQKTSIWAWIRKILGRGKRL